MIRDCKDCGERDAAAEVESSHYTSEGIVRYVRCRCGARSVDVARFGTVVGVGGTPWSTPN